jgi:hypothetical protein
MIQWSPKALHRIRWNSAAFASGCLIAASQQVEGKNYWLALAGISFLVSVLFSIRFEYLQLEQVDGTQAKSIAGG